MSFSRTPGPAGSDLELEATDNLTLAAGECHCPVLGDLERG